MKKFQFRLMVFLSLLAMLASVAAAPMAGTALSLIEVRNDGGGGVIFVFRVTGDFSKSELKGWVQVQGGDGYGLHCNQVDDTTVQCTTTKKAGGYNVVVTFGGSTFWTFVPAARGGSGPTQYCYGVYDLYSDPETESAYWGQFDTYCQDAPANFGDTLPSYYNPDYDDYYDYDFMPGSPSCFDPVNEDAYYYPYCPS